MNSNTIGGRIQALRKNRNETQSNVADALHVKRQTVDQWENGTRDLKTQYTIDLAEHFNVTCDYILRGVNAENIDAHKATGLSNVAISKLNENKKNGLGHYSKYLSAIISTNSFDDLMYSFQNIQARKFEYDGFKSMAIEQVRELYPLENKEHWQSFKSEKEFTDMERELWNNDTEKLRREYRYSRLDAKDTFGYVVDEIFPKEDADNAETQE